MTIETFTSVKIDATQERVWEYVSDLTNVPKHLKGWGPIPGVKNIKITSGHEKMSVGLTQITTLKNGGKLFETIKHVTKPSYFDYEIVGFKPPFSFLTKKGGGSWTLLREGDKTMATWRYYFHLTNPFIYPVAAILVKVFYKKVLADAIQNVKKHVE